MKSSIEMTKANIAPAKTPGAIIGSVTRRKATQGLAKRSRAASSISSVMPCIRARIGRKAKGVQKAVCARISFNIPFVRPICENRISTATATTISGSISGMFTTASES